MKWAGNLEMKTRSRGLKKKKKGLSLNIKNCLIGFHSLNRNTSDILLPMISFIIFLDKQKKKLVAENRSVVAQGNLSG